MADISCAVLCGVPFGLGLLDTATPSARVNHIFGAIQLARFREPREFRRDMDGMLRYLRDRPRAEAEERVYCAGLKEMEMEEDGALRGVPLATETCRQMKQIARERAVKLPLACMGKAT